MISKAPFFILHRCTQVDKNVCNVFLIMHLHLLETYGKSVYNSCLLPKQDLESVVFSLNNGNKRGFNK